MTELMKAACYHEMTLERKAELFYNALACFYDRSYDDRELYLTLSVDLGMTDEEIISDGFEFLYPYTRAGESA